MEVTTQEQVPSWLHLAIGTKGGGRAEHEKLLFSTISLSVQF